MKTQQIYNAITDVPDELLAEAQTTRLKSRKPNRIVMRWCTVAASLAILVAGAIVYTTLPKAPPYIDNTNPNGNLGSVTDTTKETDSNYVDPKTLSNEIRGLPAENFTITGDTHSTMSRIGYTELSHFFEFGVDCVLIVEVTNVQQYEAYDWMTSNNFNVLEVVYGDYNEYLTSAVRHISVSPLIGGTPTQTRIGGVYILPLIYDKQNHSYYDIGCLDVLFEIDDAGKIHSHSQYEGFNKFDEQDYTVLVDEIQSLASSDDFMLYASEFGSRVWSFRLIELEVTSESRPDKTPYNTDITVQNVRVTGNYSNADIPEYIEVYSTEEDGIVNLEVGGRYLLFIDIHEYTLEGGGISEPVYGVRNQHSAVIHDDGTIESVAVSQEYNRANVFLPYDGYTVEQIKELADRVNRYDY